MHALADTDGVELFVANIMASAEAPFDETMFAWIEDRYQWEGAVKAEMLISKLDEFCPDVILCANWHNSGYRKVLRHFERKAVRIFASDRPWLGRPKQWLGVFTSKFYLHPLCDAFFVAGERQAVFAQKLGFAQGRILRGLYSCDHAKFAAMYFERKRETLESCSFVFVGRLSPEKGIEVLVEAYRQYRTIANDPWPLKCYGTGPLQNLVEGVEGIECKGFCQPDDLPAELSQASCLVLPSLFEPWALVVHEAAATGLPLIISDAVGASVHLVQDGYNGYVVETGDSNELASAMLRFASLSQIDRNTMGERSYQLSLQFTPERWAEMLVNKARELMPVVRVAR